VNFLVDNQLPAALSRFLTTCGQRSQHMLDIGLDEAKDTPVRDYAKTHGLIVVSKDEDFFHLELPNIEQAFATGQRIVELR
jgi:predicted nuclease of predicted toxin-antitoxin system